MTPMERDLRRAAVKSKKERLSGIHNEVCLGCGCDLAQGKEDDHMARPQARRRGLAALPSLSSQAIRTPARGAAANQRLAQRVRGYRPVALVGGRIF